MKIRFNRVAIAVAAATVTVGLTLAPSAALAATSPQASSAAQWLAAQVPSSTHLFESAYDGGTFVDYGLNLDLQYALDQLDNSSAADRVYDAVVAHAADYTDAYGTRYSGAVGKLATYMELHRDDPTDVDGRNLIEDLEGLMVTGDGDEAGRLKDSPDGEYQSANSIGQSWGVRALAGAGSDATKSAEDFLVAQQCTDGGFRLYQDGTDCTSSPDATVFAVAALKAAGGYRTELTHAVDYLKAQQADDGSLSDTGVPNSNSTGLAAVVFASVGDSAAATKAGDWIAPLQATASTSRLKSEAGAIAYDHDSFVAGKAKGIDAIERDKWVRATVQAALGVNFASAPASDPEPGPVASLKLHVSDASPTKGDTITVTATGKDADGTSTGDVSGDLLLTSSVASDTIDGNKVTFNHASPHRIRVTHLPSGTTASITVQVSPKAAEGSTNGGGSGGGTVTGSDQSLPDTGSPVAPWQLAIVLGLIVLGGAMVISGRSRNVIDSIEDR
jgi:hypothetical protein